MEGACSGLQARTADIDADMSHDAGHEMKTRLRSDLRAAMKERRADDARPIRSLVAAIDNAEAPPLPVGRKAADQHRFPDGSAEAERLLLSLAQVRTVLMAQIEERESAADEMNRLGKPDRAAALRAEALLARRYLE